jgi:hypothetical protein
MAAPAAAPRPRRRPSAPPIQLGAGGDLTTRLCRFAAAAVGGCHTAARWWRRAVAGAGRSRDRRACCPRGSAHGMQICVRTLVGKTLTVETKESVDSLTVAQVKELIKVRPPPRLAPPHPEPVPPARSGPPSIYLACVGSTGTPPSWLPNNAVRGGVRPLAPIDIGNQPGRRPGPRRRRATGETDVGIRRRDPRGCQVRSAGAVPSAAAAAAAAAAFAVPLGVPWSKLAEISTDFGAPCLRSKGHLTSISAVAGRWQSTKSRLQLRGAAWSMYCSSWWRRENADTSATNNKG